MTTRRKPKHPGDRASVRAQKIARHARRIADDNAKAQRERIDQANAEFASQMLTTRARIYMTADGEDATELLAQLAIALGTPAEAGARSLGRSPAWVRQLHGALRIILDMCLQSHYRWRSDMADALDRAMEIALDRPDTIQPEHFLAAFIEAKALADTIMSHTVTEGAIA